MSVRQSTIKPEFVDFIPERLEAGIIYISERYNTASHKCCCGCDEEVVTPLTPADWSVQIVRNTISLTPSIGNWSFPCKSHYWIRNNKVVWAGTLSQRQIEQVRVQDKADKDAYIAAVNLQKSQQAWPWSVIAKLWQKIKRYWKS